MSQQKFKLAASFIKKFLPTSSRLNGLSNFIHRRTYSRILDENNLNQQESWRDTVERAVNGTINMQKKHMKPSDFDPIASKDFAEEMFERVYDMKFVPPGRGLWAMGSPITEERFLYAALNNCAFVSTAGFHHGGDLIRPFTFLMDASMLGVGVGFDTKGAGAIWISDHLPTTTREFVIPDSREGWVQGLEVLLNHYFYRKSKPVFNFSLIRPAGALIKGFGGISGGPEPLQILLQSVEGVLESHKGRHLGITGIVDIMNMIGKCIVSGNVRRTAEIAFGDTSDEFLDLKNYSVNPHRASYGWTSNNSVFVNRGDTYEPIVKRILDNGEPGLVWLRSMREYSRFCDAPTYSDLNAGGSNPCITGDTLIFTTEGPKRAIDLLNTPFQVYVDGKAYDCHTGVFPTGVKDVFELKTKEGHSIKLTADHKVLVCDRMSEKKRFLKWVPAEKLRPGDMVVLNNTRDFSIGWMGSHSFDEGWLMGLLLVKGTLDSKTQTASLACAWNYDFDMHDFVLSKIKSLGDMNQGFVDNTKLWELAQELGIDDDKSISFDLCHNTSSWFQRGLISGLYDAIGFFSYYDACIELELPNKEQLQIVQLMLIHLGINSAIHNESETTTKLVISKDNLSTFFARIPLFNPRYSKLIDYFLKHAPERFVATMTEMNYVGMQPVFDCTVEKVHRFGANGIIVHNCVEMTLESFELCCLVETFPHNHENLKDFLRTLEFAFEYAKTVSLGKTPWKETNRVMSRNHRIGTSMSGIAQYISKFGMESLYTLCHEGYNHIRDIDERLSSRFRVPGSVKVTTIKPSGTTSLLAGATPGMHYPIAPFYKRRVRLPSNSSLVPCLRRSGYHVEAAFEGNNTSVVEFPVSLGNSDIPCVQDVSVHDQLALAAFLQRNWSDNGVSCTVTFDPQKETVESLTKELNHFQHHLKAVSFLPNIPNVYPQMPYEAISEAEYLRLSKDLKPLDWGSGQDSFIPRVHEFCDGDKCEV